MPNLIKIGSDFKLPSSIDLSILDSIPVYVHKYGNSQPPKDTFHWMTYRNEGQVIGDISFARDCGKFLPEVADYVVSYLSNLVDVPILPNRVNMMKTLGSITPHVDEARSCCINMAVRDTDKAITQFYLDDGTLEPHILEPGSAYLVNVSKRHSVEALQPVERLLVTYGFGVPFLTIKSCIKP